MNLRNLHRIFRKLLAGKRKSEYFVRRGKIIEKGRQERMKKRLISALLCTAMVASMLAGCGGETEGNEEELTRTVQAPWPRHL